MRHRCRLIPHLLTRTIRWSRNGRRRLPTAQALPMYLMNSLRRASGQTPRVAAAEVVASSYCPRPLGLTTTAKAPRIRHNVSSIRRQVRHSSSSQQRGTTKKASESCSAIRSCRCWASHHPVAVLLASSTNRRTSSPVSTLSTTQRQIRSRSSLSPPKCSMTASHLVISATCRLLSRTTSSPG